MKNLKFWAGLVMAAVCVLVFTSCGRSDGKVKVSFDSGSAWVDSITAANYLPHEIEQAVHREEFLSKYQQPTDASAFGKKIRSITWRALDSNCKDKGTVEVIKYENGVEVVKDGKHWFYGGYDRFAKSPEYCREEAQFAAMESVLHPGVWEPVELEFSFSGDLIYKFAYTCGYEGQCEIYLWDFEIIKYRIDNFGDLMVSSKKY